VSSSRSASRRAVRQLAVARTLALAGAEAVFVIRSFDLFERTNSSWLLAFLMLAYFGAMAAAGPVGGVLGDRFDRRHVLVVAGVLQCVAFAPLMFVTSPPGIIALTAIAAIAVSPYWSALPAAIPNLVDEADLGWANGLVNAGMNAGIVLGPPIGGALLDGFGRGTAFAASIGLVAVGVLLVATVPGRLSAPRIDREHRSGGIGKGLRLVLADPFLRAIVIAWAILTSGLGLVLVAEVPLAASFGHGAFGYSLIAIAWGLGAVCGSLFGRHVSSGREPVAVVAGIVGLAVSLAAIAAFPALAPVLVALFAGGLADAVGEVAAQSMVQRRTTDDVASRAMAVLHTAGAASLALSFPLAGALLDVVGVRGAYLVGAATSSIAVAITARRLLASGDASRRLAARDAD